MTSATRLPLNFGGLDPESSAYASSRVVLLPIPFEATTTYRSGTREGPGAILRASRNLELYDEELDVEPYLLGLHTMDEMELSRQSPETAHEQVEELVRQVLSDGKFPVVLGGEHSLTLGAVRACQEIYPDLSVLQLDAHADLRETYHDTIHSHACIARRILEICPLVQVGIRSMSREEADFLGQGQRENVLFAAELVSGARSFVQMLPKLSSNVYVTLDVDLFDPSEMPAVGTPEPGGLNWYQVLEILRQVTRSANVVALDIMELCPLPGNVAPDFLVSKLVYKMLAYTFVDELRKMRLSDAEL